MCLSCLFLGSESGCPNLGKQAFGSTVHLLCFWIALVPIFMTGLKFRFFHGSPEEAPDLAIRRSKGTQWFLGIKTLEAQTLAQILRSSRFKENMRFLGSFIQA